MEALLTRQPVWFPQAACSSLPWTMFFCEERKDEKDLPGLVVCQTCEVKQACLDWSMQTGCREGIFGGVTSHQRDKLRRRNRPLGL